MRTVHDRELSDLVPPSPSGRVDDFTWRGLALHVVSVDGHITAASARDPHARRARPLRWAHEP
jgi:nitrite reductase/ring-hydroxylating ferredoxin subunit